MKLYSKILLSSVQIFIKGFVLSGLFFSTVYAQTEFNPNEFAINIAHAQFKAKQVIPPAPEAASLGKFGNVPVSLYTGAAQISIPLYNSPLSKISLPVSLGYSSQGFKPQEIATWVGLGWNLNAGGVITRAVQGNPDIFENYYNQTALPAPPSQQNMFTFYDLIKEMRDGRREDQSDVYYYNFGNYSGKFFVRQDGTVVKKSKDNLIITQAYGSIFTIVDEMGNSYLFYAPEATITISGGVVVMPDDVYPVHSSYGYNSAWYLATIISADGSEAVDLEYYSPPFAHQQFSNAFQNQSVTYSRTEIISPPGGPCGHTAGGTGPLITTIKNGSPPITSTTRKYLKKISITKSGSLISYIDFISSENTRLDLDDYYFPGERKLDGMKIYNRFSVGSTFTLAKEYVFNYDYFTRQTANGINNEKLKLVSLIEKPSDIYTVEKPAYAFTYNGIENSNLNFEVAIDHWGFYNGAGNSSLIPNLFISPGVYYGLNADREPNFSSVTNTLLTKITYPTGGYSSFVYEGHQAKDENGDEMNVGGVRIKEITDYSFENKKAITKKYYYSLSDNLTTSGKCQRPSYITNSSSYHHYSELCMCSSNPNVPCGCCGMWTESHTNSISMTASAVSGLGTIQGSHIGYTMVTEKQTETANGQALGKTVYEYGHTGFLTNDDDIYNGSLIRQAVYDNGNKLLSEVVNEFSYSGPALASFINYNFDANAEQDNRIKLCRYVLNGTTYYNWQRVQEYTNVPCDEYRIYNTKFSVAAYSTIAQAKYITKQTQKIYDQVSGSYLTSVKEFTYGNNAHMLPTKITQTTSGNQMVVTEKKYPLDYGTSGNDLPSAGIVSLQQQNVVGAEIETIQYRQNPDGSNKRYISGTLNLYQAALPYPKELYSLDITAPLTSFAMSSINGSGLFSYNSNYKLMGSFDFADGNVIKQGKANDIQTSYIWDYNLAHVSAEVVNAEPQMIAYSSFETDQSGQWNTIPLLTANRITGGVTGKYSYSLTSGNTITKSSLPVSRKYIVSYWSKNGALSVSSNTGSASAKTGTVHNGWTYYEHKLPVNSTSVTISSSNANIDELRLYPQDAQMNTVTYDLQKGVMMSQCSPNNSIVNFEYDGYSRLLNVKDIDGNIVKNYNYKYGLGTELSASAQTLFYNTQQQQLFYRQGCPPQSEPEPYYYIVPYGKYVSVNNLAEANAKAVADIAANGQTSANQNSLCYYWNDYRDSLFYKNNCQYWEGPPLSILYTAPIHTFSSLISKADANAKAVADIVANGQTYANTWGSCSCTMLWHRFVNGQCEMGQISFVGFEYAPNCEPGKNYRCYFFYYFSDGYQTPITSICSDVECQNY